MQRIVILGITGALNSGDHALCAAVIRFLREVFPAASIIGVHRDPELQKRHFPDVRWVRQIGASSASNRILRRLRNASGLGMAAFGNATGLSVSALLPSADREAYKQLATADLVVGCPGGWLEDNHVSVWANLIQLNVAKAHRVPIFFAPQSIGPFRKKLSRRAAARLFSSAEGIALRDEISETYLRVDLNVCNVPAETFPDMAFYENEADLATASEVLRRLTGSDSCRLAGSTVLEWSFPGAAAPRQALDEYLAKVIATARELYLRQGIQTVFLRQIRDADGYEGDRAIVARLRTELGPAGFACEDFLEPAVLRGVIRRCEVFWGTRLHANIFAMTQRVPVVGIAYQHKTLGIMKMMGQGEYVVQIDNFTVPELLSRIERALEQRIEIIQALEDNFAFLQERRAALNRFLLTCLDKSTISAAP